MSSQSTLFPFETTQVNMARTLKSMLDLGQQINLRQAGAAQELLRGTLGAFHPSALSATRELLDLQADLAAGLGAQWKSTLDHFIERGGACIGDLRRADDHSEMPGLLVVFASDLGQQLRADTGRLARLIGSASEAGKVLFARALDGMVDGADSDGRADPA